MTANELDGLIRRIESEAKAEGAATAFDEGQTYLKGQALCAVLDMVVGETDPQSLARLNAMCAVLNALKPACVVALSTDPGDLTELLRASVEAAKRRKVYPKPRAVT